MIQKILVESTGNECMVCFKLVEKKKIFNCGHFVCLICENKLLEHGYTDCIVCHRGLD